MSSFVRYVARALGLFVLSFVLTATVRAQGPSAQIIVATPRPYTNVVSAIQGMGGTVRVQYKYVNAIAATVPSSALPKLRDLVGKNAISPDTLISAPGPARTGHRRVSKTGTGIYASAPVGPGARIFNSALGNPKTPLPESVYAVNLKNTSIRGMHNAGFTGKGITVAVIDSGVRPGYFALDSDGSVIGGENLVPDGVFSSRTNDPHGTFVATLISGNAGFVVPPSSTLTNSMKVNFPGTLQSTQLGSVLSVVGSAPEASIYAIRVFGSLPNAGSPKSRIMSAIERVIQLREMYNNGVDGGVNIKVCNLSFGTSTTFAGNTPLEQLIDQLFQNDIVPVIGAGDGGPSSLTISSPATSFSSLTVGATSPAANERLWRDLTMDFGSLARPSSATQTASFSSRGPTADGRTFPDVTAAGFGVLSQGCGGDDGTGACIYNPASIDVASGTSFSGPIVAGAAVLLRQKFPNASVGQIWNALVNGANSSLLGDDSTALDQGHGVIDLNISTNLIQSGSVSDQLPRPPVPTSSVPTNIQSNTNLIVSHGTVQQSFTALKPGERGEILYEVADHTNQITIDISNVTPSLPPSQQNPFFGDDIFLNVHTAKTSAGAFGDYFVIDPPFTNAFIVSDTTIVIPNPEPGVIRITLLGDSTNAGTISANVMVTASLDPIPPVSASGDIFTGDNLVFSLDIPAGVQSAKFQLRWTADWDSYPTNDLDMYLFDPLGGVDGDGATLSSPENAIVSSPVPGTWNILIQGFAIFTNQEKFEVSAILDGITVKLKPTN